MNDALALNNEQHEQNLAHLALALAHIRRLSSDPDRARVETGLALVTFQAHEQLRLRARARAGYARVPSPHDQQYRTMLVQVRVSILSAMQGESEVVR